MHDFIVAWNWRTEWRCCWLVIRQLISLLHRLTSTLVHDFYSCLQALICQHHLYLPVNVIFLPYGWKSTVIIHYFPSLRREIYKHMYAIFCLLRWKSMAKFYYFPSALLLLRKHYAPLFLCYPKINPFLYVRQLIAWLIILFIINNASIRSCQKISSSCRMLSWVQLNKQMGSAIIFPTHKPCCVPPRKIPFINPE